MTVATCKLDPQSSKGDIHNVIVECLQHSHLDDALTLSELYYEKDKSDEALLYMSECLNRLGRMEELYALLSSVQLNNPRVRYNFARCCYDLNKLDESMRVLTTDKVDFSTTAKKAPFAGVELHKTIDGSTTEPYANILLSKILCETGAQDRGCMLVGRGIEAKPLLWSAIRQYLQLGGKDATRLLDGGLSAVRKDEDKKDIIDDKDVVMEDVNEEDEVNDLRTPVNNPPSTRVSLGAPRKASRASDVTNQDSRRITRLALIQDTENAGTRTTRVTKIANKTSQLRSITRTNQVIGEAPVRISRSPSQRKTTEAKQPLASRNANSIRSSSSQSLAAGSRKKVEEKEKEKEKKVEVETIEPPKPQHSTIYLHMMTAFRSLTEVEECISKYNWKAAAEAMEKVPADTQRHALASLQKARVLFESSDYQAAKELLLEVRRSHPYRIDGMDLLSTALWHIQGNHDLSVLAQDLTTRARTRPESWIAAGNCFSLNKQHAKAVECFERAIRLDLHYAYAYSLLGHELIETEDMDKASQAFRKALSINPNDYRAWYGLGMVNFRKEQHLLAQRDLARALQLNSSNVSLLCQLAVVEKSIGRMDESIKLLNYALNLDPNRMVARFHLAKLKYDVGEFDDCISHLEELKVLSPDEAQIFFLLGKAHRRKGNTHLALLNFNWAAEMDPRGEQTMNYMNEQPYDDDGTTMTP